MHFIWIPQLWMVKPLKQLLLEVLPRIPRFLTSNHWYIQSFPFQTHSFDLYLLKVRDSMNGKITLNMKQLSYQVLSSKKGKFWLPKLVGVFFWHSGVAESTSDYDGSPGCIPSFPFPHPSNHDTDSPISIIYSFIVLTSPLSTPISRFTFSTLSSIWVFTIPCSLPALIPKW